MSAAIDCGKGHVVTILGVRGAGRDRYAVTCTRLGWPYTVTVTARGYAAIVAELRLAAVLAA